MSFIFLANSWFVILVLTALVGSTMIQHISTRHSRYTDMFVTYHFGILSVTYPAYVLANELDLTLLSCGGLDRQLLPAIHVPGTARRLRNLAISRSQLRHQARGQEPKGGRCIKEVLGAVPKEC